MKISTNGNKYFRSSLGLEKNKLSQEEEEWRQLLPAYGFIGLDDVDRVLVSSLDKGIIEEEPLKAALAKQMMILKEADVTPP